MFSIFNSGMETGKIGVTENTTECSTRKLSKQWDNSAFGYFVVKITIDRADCMDCAGFAGNFGKFEKFC
jgi:hypothetical protein